MARSKNAMLEEKFLKEEFIPIYNLFRDYIKSEDSLINSRMTWMLIIHGFLYATYGFSLQKILEINEKSANLVAIHACDPDFLNNYIEISAFSSTIYELIFFLFCICFVGGVISFTAFLSVSAAYDAATAVHLLFDEYVKSESFALRYVYKIDEDLHIPLLTGGGFKNNTETRGFHAAWSIPVILLASWLGSLAFLAAEYNKEKFFLSGKPICSNNTKPARHGKNEKVLPFDG